MIASVLRLALSAVASKLGVYSPRHGSNGCLGVAFDSPCEAP